MKTKYKGYSIKDDSDFIVVESETKPEEIIKGEKTYRYFEEYSQEEAIKDFKRVFNR